MATIPVVVSQAPTTDESGGWKMQVDNAPVKAGQQPPPVTLKHPVDTLWPPSTIGPTDDAGNPLTVGETGTITVDFPG
jgi:hypothetical protein